MCALGNSRSVALAYLLKSLGHEAIAVGAETISPQTRAYLSSWADKIAVVDRRFVGLFDGYQEKVLPWYVDGDPYFKGFDPELIETCKGHYRESRIHPSLPLWE